MKINHKQRLLEYIKDIDDYNREVEEEDLRHNWLDLLYDYNIDGDFSVEDWRAFNTYSDIWDILYETEDLECIDICINHPNPMVKTSAYPSDRLELRHYAVIFKDKDSTIGGVFLDKFCLQYNKTLRVFL